MALEEHFAKELQEANGRKEGAIVKFDENDVWAARDGHGFAGFGGGAFDSYRNAEVVPVGGMLPQDGSVLATHQASAVGLLRGFVAGKLPASAVFDAQRLGAYLAAIDAWKAWHALRWHNLRFSYDPYIARLEPIAFDASLQDSDGISGQSLLAEPIAARMLDDPAVDAAYRAALRRLDEGLRNGELAARLEQTQRSALAALHREFFFLPSYPMQAFSERAAALAARGEIERPRNGGALPRFVRARLVDVETGTLLELENAIASPLTIVAASWSGPGAAPTRPALADVLPLRLEATRHGEQPAQHVLSLDRVGGTLTLRVRAERYGEERDVVAVAGLAPRDATILPESSLEEQLALHPFLVRGAANELVVPAGEHRVAATLVVPPGARLRAEAGAALRFAGTAALIAWGPLELRGEAGNPVRLGAADAASGWPGLAVLMAPAPSRWSHVEVSDTVEAKLPGWHLTGGVNFYASELHASDVRFRNARGEDALNTIRTHFTLERIHVERTRSDAFDSDFCTGTVRDSHFQDIGLAGGGDAIDVSGSDVAVEDVRFERVSDKALSVGEGSRMRATGISAEGVGAGAVAKDGSQLELKGARFRGARVAPLMAYVKKPEFGVARIVAHDVAVEGELRESIAQTGSSIELDGHAVETQSVDVEALYETAMKKAAAL
jgi:hypothetical protein